ncbi:MAG: hypothetical protein HYZ69_00590 [Candidatus Colwellbacteria bacterium]|nr:hypothetical protein [Candidatus Colwellbacteria bacterium]
MKYDYTTYLPGDNGTFIRRPMVEVEIVGPKGKHKELTLVDSGADRSLFNKEIASIIGIDLSHAAQRNVMGISGIIKVYTAEVTLRLPHFEHAIKISTDFTDSPYVGALLGQEGFFDFHRIKFERDHNVFEINLIKKE